MKLVTADQMRAVDQYAIERLRIPGLELMESAGRGIAEWIHELYGDSLRDLRVAVISGKGNNGGDGFVVARYLVEWGAAVKVFIVGAPESFRGDALTNFERAKRLALSFVELTDANRVADSQDFDLIVDAIFGTGFKGVARGRIGELIDWINQADLPVVSVDTPSGLNNDTGEVEGPCVRATFTASLALPKMGQYFYPGRAYCGRTRVLDIGIPAEAVAEVDSQVELVTASMVKQRIPDRAPTCHKGDCGKLFIVGGAVGMTGAVALTADSAVKSGAGLVYAGVPRSLNDILEVKLTEALTRPLPELRKTRALPVRALGPILENIRAVDACCLGPGVGRHFETVELFRRLLKNLDRPAVLDADGLYPFSERAELLSQCEAPLVLTPHAGEFARLVGKRLPGKQLELIEPLREYAGRISKVVLLKGAPTLICSPEGEIYLSPTGNPGMASGGSGDVLTGVIGSLLALGLQAVDAAVCGAYLHGLAGDLAREDVGTFGLSATDLVHYLPEALLLLKDDFSGTNST
jgi:NAD(P)H-hydrate epimerase